MANLAALGVRSYTLKLLHFGEQGQQATAAKARASLPLPERLPRQVKKLENLSVALFYPIDIRSPRKEHRRQAGDRDLLIVERFRLEYFYFSSKSQDSQHQIISVITTL